jgi:2-polyprenyl-3-methyl-5-hydroxy-6-metoxy-1,4-benzoquinol methylase
MLLLMPVFAVYAPKGMPILLIATGATLGLRGCFGQTDCKTDGRLGRWMAVSFSPLIVFGLASSLWAVDSQHSALVALRLAGLAFAAFVLWRGLEGLGNPERRVFETQMLASGLVLLALTGLESATDLVFMSWLKGLDRRPGHNDYLTYINGGMALLALYAPLVALLIAKRTGRIWSLVFLLATAAVLYRSNAATPVLGFILALVAYVATRLLGGVVPKAMGIGAVLAVLAAPIAWQKYLDYRGGLQGLEHSVGWSSLHRLHIWTFAEARIQEKPLLGWGLDSSRSIPGGNRGIPGYGTAEYMPLHPHNGALQIWMELGLVGTLAFALVLWRLFEKVSRLGEDRALAAAAITPLAAYLTQGMLSFGLWQSWWLSSLALCLISIALLRDRPKDGGDTGKEWSIVDQGDIRVFHRGGQSYRTPYFREVIEAIVSRKGVDRAATYLTFKSARTAYVKPLAKWLEGKGMRNLRILEAGCEAGHVTEFLNDQSFTGEIWAYDVDRAFIDIAALKKRDLGLSKLVRLDHFTSEQTRSLPYPEDHFDLVIVLAVVEHMPFEERNRHIDALWRVVKPGGLIAFLDTPNRLYPFESHSVGLPFIARMSPETAFLYARAAGKLEGVPFSDFMRPGTGWRNASYSECLPQGRMLQVQDISREAGYGFPFFLHFTAGRWRKGVKLVFWGPVDWLCCKLGVPFEFFIPNLNLVFRKGQDYEAKGASS